MNLKMVGVGGEVLAEKNTNPKPKKAKGEDLFNIDKVDPEFRDMMCDKLIRACDLIGENPRTGETKVCDTPEEARAWEMQAEREGLNMVMR